MLKLEAAKKYVELKMIWWSIADGIQQPEWKRAELLKNCATMSKVNIVNQIGFLESRIANAKTIMAGLM